MLSPGSVVALEGELGSGKTAMVQGLAKGLGLNPKEVRSPTFAIVQEHRGGRVPLCHADLYRLAPAETVQLGLEEYWSSEGEWIVAIEWAERAGKWIPANRLDIEFQIVSRHQRKISFSGNQKWKKILSSLKKKF